MCPGRLPHDRNLMWVATKGTDVRLYPFQGRADIVYAESPIADTGVIQKAQRAQPIIDTYDNYIASIGERRAIVPIERTRAAEISSTMQPDEDRSSASVFEPDQISERDRSNNRCHSHEGLFMSANGRRATIDRRIKRPL